MYELWDPAHYSQSSLRLSRLMVNGKSFGIDCAVSTIRTTGVRDTITTAIEREELAMKRHHTSE